MATFKGCGPGKGTWKRRRYLPDGTVLEGDAPTPKVATPGIRHRFKPFTSYQVTEEAAKRAGAHRKGKATHFTSEAQLNRYLANEKAAGRFAAWKQHDEKSDLTPEKDWTPG